MSQNESNFDSQVKNVSKLVKIGQNWSKFWFSKEESVSKSVKIDYNSDFNV